VILNDADLDRLETFATADMSDPATADNCRRFAHEALPDLLETIRYWSSERVQLALLVEP
jgi:hypothetical protein